MKTLSILFLLLIMSTSSAFAALTHVESNSSINYWIHYPQGYKSSGAGFPVLITLHGLGEKGDGKNNSHNYNLVTRHGPGKLIKNNTWDNSLPFIVVAPQLPSNQGGWWVRMINEVIDHVKANNNVDTDRLYLTGLSLGGQGVWIGAKDGHNPIAAIIPIAGWGSSNCDMTEMGVWAFHGDNDNTIKLHRGQGPVTTINNCNPKPTPEAKITIFPGVGHDSWTRTYDNKHGDSHVGGDGKVYTNIYRWLLSHSLNKGYNPPPVNNPPSISSLSAQTVEEGKTKRINVSASDEDGDSISLSLQSAPSFVSIIDNGNGSAQIDIAPQSGNAGSHTVKVQAKDPSGASATASFNLTVTAAPVVHPDPDPVDEDYVPGLVYKHYHHSGWTSIPDLSELTPVKQGVTSVIGLDERTINDRFAFSFEGYIRIDVAGSYTFSLASDDGSNLYLDDVRLIDNDGAHGLQKVSKTISLSPGLKKIRVDYFDNYGSEALEVTYKGPGFNERALPQSALFHIPDGNIELPGDYISGLKYKHYHGAWSALPDFSTLSPVKEGIVSEITLSPATQNDNFAFLFEGYLEVPVTGDYTFYLSSDDGSKLFIDNALVIDNDGLHGATDKLTKKIRLGAGHRKIRVEYFERSGGEVLNLTYSGPGFGERSIPADALFYSSSGGSGPIPTPPADTTAPVITLIGSSTITIQVGDSFNDPGAKANDDVDGDISSKITKSGSVNTSKTGNYTIHYNVKDQAGNSAKQISRTVVVEPKPESYAQKVIIDVGAQGYQDPNANNIVSQGQTITLKDVNGKSTNMKLVVTNFNDGVNQDGTTSPASATGISNHVSRDSFFGNDQPFQGQIKPKGQVKISNLDKNATYKISLFASRMNVNNNRQTKYTVKGAAQKVVNLDVHNNTSKIAVADGIRPDANGQINIDVQKGANNNDGSGFFYLGGMIIESTTESAPPAAPVVPDLPKQKMLVDVGAHGYQDPNANNIVSQDQTITLKDVDGKNTSVKLLVTNFNSGVNQDGTTSPASALGISKHASRDSFFGNDKSFQGQIKPKGQVKISNLDKSRSYKVSLFASRMNVNNNRQTQYTVKGAGQKIVNLDVHNNTSKIAVVSGMKPDSNGQINIDVQKGPNNNDGNGFFYLGGMIIETDD